MGGERKPNETWRLADGSEVPGIVAIVAYDALTFILKDYGAIAATDLVDLAKGQQPNRTPMADLRPVYAKSGLCERYRDGSLQMHDLIATVVRNAVHINPKDAFEWRLSDPREPFPGFNS